jgi:hypothetical protein
MAELMSQGPPTSSTSDPNTELIFASDPSARSPLRWGLKGGREEEAIV